jgi:linoleate 9S-lipoxygenase
VSAKVTVEDWLGDADPVADFDSYEVTFTVPGDFGTPGAIIIENHHPHEFYSQKLELQAPEGALDASPIQFATNAWIYNYEKYLKNPPGKDRVFFRNKV